MRCTHTFRIGKNLDPSEFPHGLEVPCGKCFSCRQHRANEWALRMMHEFGYWKKAVFLTLTYDPEKLPYVQHETGRYVTSRYYDVQLFWKRLRRKLKDRRIRYYCAVEYSPKMRPHYHAIVFGLGQDDYSLMRDAWNNGFIYVEQVNIRTIQYVTGYIHKQYFDQSMRNTCKDYGIEIPHSRKSQGLGRRYAFNNMEKLRNRMWLYDIDGNKRSIPRYYINVLHLNEDEQYKQMIKESQEARQRQKYKEAIGIDDLTDEIYLDYMENSPDWQLAADFVIFRRRVIQQEYRNHRWRASSRSKRDKIDLPQPL